MVANENDLNLTPLPDYFGRKAFIVGQTRPQGSPPDMSGIEIIPEGQPLGWHPPAEQETAE